MKVRGTGAPGNVGHRIATKPLVERRDDVRALVRSPDRARSVLPAGIELVLGDATEPTTLAPALRDVEIGVDQRGINRAIKLGEGRKGREVEDVEAVVHRRMPAVLTGTE